MSNRGLVNSFMPLQKNIIEKQLKRIAERLNTLENGGIPDVDLTEIITDIATLQNDLNTEQTERINADNNLQNNINFVDSLLDDEKLARENAVIGLQNDITDLENKLDNINEVPNPVAEGYALVSTGANEYDFVQMDSDDNTPMTIGYFNKNAHKSEFISINEFAGAFPIGTTDPKLLVEAYLDAVNTDPLNPIVILEDGDHFLQYFDSSIGGNPVLWVYDLQNDLWTFYNTLQLNPGQWFTILNFVSNWEGIEITEQTSGTLTWTLASTGTNNFLYEQFNTQNTTGTGGFPPDETTITLNSAGKLQVIDYVSKTFVDTMLGNVEALILAI